MSLDAPLSLHRDTVRPDWIDFNGHMNVAYYVLAFDGATDRFFDHLGLDAAYRHATNRSTFALEQHILYLREVKEGDPLRFTTQLIDHDAKRIHYFHRMYNDREGYLAQSVRSETGIGAAAASAH